MNDFRNIKTDFRNGIYTVTLAREPKRNAIDELTMDELANAFTTLPSGVNIAILAAEGRDFCAGADLEWMRTTQEMTIAELQEQNMKLRKVFELWYNLPVFTIALIHGNVVGGAIGLVAASDLVIANPDTVFRFSEVLLGLMPATIAPYVFQRTGSRAIRNAMLTAKPFDAATALHAGLTDHVADHTLRNMIIDEYKSALNKNEPGAVAATKKLANDIQMNLIKDNLDIYTTGLLAKARKSEAASARISAFLNSTHRKDENK
jgi:methylglutaconyl-CoA hydratase